MSSAKRVNRDNLTVGGLTVANFALVLSVLVAISLLGTEQFDTGIVNVWSIWGIAHVSIGQTLQVITALPRAGSRTKSWLVVVGTTLLATAVVLLLRDRLFPSLGLSWSCAAIVGVVAAGASGVLRGDLVRQRRATASLAVVCSENALRALLVVSFLAFDVGASLLPWSIVLPFLLSLPLLLALGTARSGNPDRAVADLSDSPEMSATMGGAALTMIPSLVSYALIPVLSALDNLPSTIDVDALAFDAALARGPVQVAVFLAPKVLEWMIDPATSGRRSALATPAMLAALCLGCVAAAALVGSTSFVGRVALVAVVGATGLCGYAALLDSVDRVQGGRQLAFTVVFATAAFLAGAASGDVGGLAPIAWGCTGAIGGLVLAGLLGQPRIERRTT